MTKRIISLTLSVILLMTMVMPSVSMAEDKPKWWERALDIVVADALGALEGYLETESTGGAIVGGIAGSLEEGLDQGISGGNWTMDEEYAESIGLYHNKGLNFYFDQEDSENINAILLEYLSQEGLVEDREKIQVYLRGLDPTLEELLRRIKEGTTGPFNPETGDSDGADDVIVSENFFSNLQQTLSIIDGDGESPQQVLDEAIVFLLNASLKETAPDLQDDLVMYAQDYNSSRSNKPNTRMDLGGDGTGLSFDEIQSTYEEQKEKGQPVDIILAWVFVDVLQHSSLYWSDVYCWGDNKTSEQETSDDNGGVLCWGANFERLMMDPDADPNTGEVFIQVDKDWTDEAEDEKDVDESLVTITSNEKEAAELTNTIGILKGDGGNYEEYLSKTATRMQAFILSLRFKGLEQEALDQGYELLENNPNANYKDVNSETVLWKDGLAMLAYGYAHPELGWIGDSQGNFNPYDQIDAQQFTKVIATLAGYEQNVDYTWQEVIDFSKGKNIEVPVISTLEPLRNYDLAEGLQSLLLAKAKGTDTIIAEKMVEEKTLPEKTLELLGINSQGSETNE